MGPISNSTAAGHNRIEILLQHLGSDARSAAHFRRDVRRFCHAARGDGDDNMAQALGGQKAREINDDTQARSNRVFDRGPLRSGPADYAVARWAHAASLE